MLLLDVHETQEELNLHLPTNIVEVVLGISFQMPLDITATPVMVSDDFIKVENEYAPFAFFVLENTLSDSLVEYLGEIIALEALSTFDRGHSKA